METRVIHPDWFSELVQRIYADVFADKSSEIVSKKLTDIIPDYLPGEVGTGGSVVLTKGPIIFFNAKISK